MKEFDNLIKYCAQEFNSTPFCSTCSMEQCRRCGTNNCYNCLAHIHSINTKNEHYDCKKITYNYILKHGYRYASEMAWAFQDIKQLFDHSLPISIISVGCGPSTELYGAAAIFQNTQLHYYGFDTNKIWHTIQQYNKENFNGHLHTIDYYDDCDFIKYMKDSDTTCDILVLNYFFSDYVKYNPSKCDNFIDDLVELIKDGRFLTIIINDIMLLYNTGTGYACMESIAKKLQASNKKYTFSFQRRHFATPNQFQFEYGIKKNDNIGFKNIIQEAQPFNPFTTCGSIQLIIKTNKIKQQ